MSLRALGATRVSDHSLTASYHHDGKHNVMAIAYPIEIFGELDRKSVV